jgi:hypothetical protein
MLFNYLILHRKQKIAKSVKIMYICKHVCMCVCTQQTHAHLIDTCILRHTTHALENEEEDNIACIMPEFRTGNLCNATESNRICMTKYKGKVAPVLN